ncbi:MAG: hypothetical protein IJF12_02090 [Alphaproteobacteria bacterium]|nr:hypothetical protein [Alphaproteobacteria bacterium]
MRKAMYLWVVMATFIAILYSFNLPIRADLDRVHAETKASVVVTKFFAQHNAVKDYFNSQARDKTGQSSVTYYPGDGVNISADTEGTDVGTNVKKYLPIGFIEDESTISKVYCLENGDRASPQCTSTPDGSCCSAEYTGIYVVSYRQIPSRWINKVTKMPNADILGYMGKARGYGKSFGYTDNIDGKLVLSGGQMVQEFDTSGEKVGDAQFEYHEIFEAVKNDPDFENCMGENVHCLYAIQQIYG